MGLAHRVGAEARLGACPSVPEFIVNIMNYLYDVLVTHSLESPHKLSERSTVASVLNEHFCDPNQPGIGQMQKVQWDTAVNRISS
jgi:hypothetical protein